jgi:hypothetical protein
VAGRATDLRLLNRCLGWARAECQKHSFERSGEEWAARRARHARRGETESPGKIWRTGSSNQALSMPHRPLPGTLSSTEKCSGSDVPPGRHAQQSPDAALDGHALVTAAAG